MKKWAIQKLQAAGWVLTTNPETIYWHAAFPRSIAHGCRVDIRQARRRKPLLLEQPLTHRAVMIEWDYGQGGWLVYDADCGDILAHEARKADALLRAASALA